MDGSLSHGLKGRSRADDALRSLLMALEFWTARRQRKEGETRSRGKYSNQGEPCRRRRGSRRRRATRCTRMGVREKLEFHHLHLHGEKALTTDG